MTEAEVLEEYNKHTIEYNKQTINVQDDYDYFESNYSLKVLEDISKKSLRDLAVRLFSSRDVGVQNNAEGLVTWIERGYNDKRKPFGTGRSIVGQTGVLLKEDGKFYKYERDNSKGYEITDTEAESIAQNILEILKYTCNVISNYTLDDIDDYVRLSKELKDYLVKQPKGFYWNKDGSPRGCLLKYYHCTFKEKFSCWYAPAELKEVLTDILEQKPLSNEAFILNGQLALYAKKNKMDNAKLGDLLGSLLEEHKQTIQQENESKSKEITIWKVSHGLKVFSDDERKEFEEEKIAVVNRYTRTVGRKSKDTSEYRQGDDWLYNVKKGDYFYLCYGNNVRLFGRFTEDTATVNPLWNGKGQDELYQRKYEVIKEADESVGEYKEASKRWAPNSNSTFIQVPKKDLGEFEKNLLKPYFGLTLGVLTEDNFNTQEESDIKSGEVYKSDGKFPLNRIVFGAPGTGKSFQLNKEVKELLQKNPQDYERVTFHPDYTYAQFVGTYKPVPDENDEKIIKYKYVPGPFMRMFVKAKQNPDRPFLLIIEEINRANTAAVFGDVFQLLDRDDDGESEYPIAATEDMKRYLKTEGIEEEQVKIPANLYLWATMNSADQGVFPMDTAFKRRWSFEYIGIDDGEEEIKNKTFTIKGQTIYWNDLRKAINHALVTAHINEDKLLGPFFVSPNEMNDNEKFIKAVKYKVLMYLFEDAARQWRSQIFSIETTQFSMILKKFEEKGIEVFADRIVKEYNDKHPVTTTQTAETAGATEDEETDR
jgi:hypothetical protein